MLLRSKPNFKNLGVIIVGYTLFDQQGSITYSFNNTYNETQIKIIKDDYES